MKKGWERKALSEIMQLSYGKPLDKKDRNPKGRYPVYGANGEKDRTDKCYYNKPSVIVGRKGSAGEVNLTEAGFWPLDVTYFITFDDIKYELKFLFYLLTTLDLPKLAKGVKPGINRNDVYSIKTLVPPLAEQKRIVALLDEAFAGLATAQANAEKNLQNARALFESQLQTVFSKRGEGWVEKRLGELCEVFEDGNWIESKDQSTEGIRLIQTGNVGEGAFKNRADKARYISEATFKRLRCREIFEGDCLISRLPDPVGRSCILPNTGERMITAVDCTIVRFSEAKYLPALFNLYSQSSEYIGAVADRCTGTTRNRISRSNLGLINIPVPPLPKQCKIVAHLDALSSETQRLTKIYEQKQAALAALKKSLLHEAFSGAL